MADDEESSNAQLRKKILAIQADTSLTAKEKSMRVQDIMMAKWRKGNGAEAASTSPVEQDEEAQRRNREPTYRVAPGPDGEGGVLGCKHYPRGCKLWASCCSKYVTCRLCHDEEVGGDHKLDRYSVERVLCMGCGAEQAPSEACTECGLSFARYVCLKCNFFDDTEGKAIYHCDKCGLCRVGQGLGIDFWHCDTCQMCLAMNLENHICIEKNIMSNCPICHEYMFTSTESIHILNRCGHCMHQSCFMEYIESSIVCPLCSKSIFDMSEEWVRLDQLMALQVMPPEYADSVSHILCNDCGSETRTPYSFHGHKCSDCGSYNTRTTFVDHPEHIVQSRLGNMIQEEQQAQQEAANNGNNDNGVADMEGSDSG